jgi:predicted SAM-dependent methyltransferase
MNKNKIKLNLGCGHRKMHGFINVDVRKDLKPDVVADVTRIHELYNDVDLIYACHVLEHFPLRPSSFQPITWKEVLESWYKTLKTGGVLRLAIPNIEAVCKHYINTGELDDLYAYFYGGQKYDFDFHYHCWSFDTLKKDLQEMGFKDIKKYDWKKTEHYFVDDYSQAYLPHMDKVNGTLLSLNVEAIK